MFQRSPIKLAACLAILLACGCGDDSSAPIVDDPEAPPVFQYTIGRSREGRMMYPSSIDLDDQGNIYLVNEGGSYDGTEIYKMDARGHFIKNWPLFSAVIGGGSASSNRLESKSEADFAGRAYSSLIVSGNTILAADHSHRRIIRFDLEGNILDSWGKYGMGDGEFLRLQDVAEDAEGNVYALDGESYRVQKFSADGTFLLQWGRQGTRPGEFETATGLAVDPAGFVYVGDLELQRIQKFDLQGVFLDDWQIERQPTEYRVEIVRLSLDNEGHLLVLSDGDRLSKWSSDGVLLDEWATETDETSPAYCVDVAVDSNGNLLFVEIYEHILSRFSADGSFLGTLANEEPDEADVEQIQAIAVNSRGSLLVASEYSRLSEFSRTGEFLSTRIVLGEVGGRIEKIIAGSLSNVYLLLGEAFHRLVPGETAELLPGQPLIPQGLRFRSVSMDSHERILVLGSDSRIYTYDPQRGTHSSFDFDLPGETSEYEEDCEDCLHNVPWLVTSVAGTVWVAYFQFQPDPDEFVFEAKPNRIRIFGSDGTWRDEFEFDSEGTVSEASIAAIHFDSSRFLYVLDEDKRMRKFSRYGKLVSSWTVDMNASLESQIACDGSRAVYILDPYMDQIVKYGY